LDEPAAGTDQRAVEAVGPFGLSQHRAPFAGSVRLRFARQSQESVRSSEPERIINSNTSSTSASNSPRARFLLLVWTPRRRNWWARSKMLAGSGARRRCLSTITIFARRPRASRFLGTLRFTGQSGSVLIGTSHDTPQFAVDAIVDWWRGQGADVTDRLRSCSSWPIAAGATEPGVGSGSMLSKKNWSIPTSWR